MFGRMPGPVPMILALDVHYEGRGARAVGLGFADWSDATPQGHVTVEIGAVEPYAPGQFYLRELPCLLAVIGEYAQPPEVVIVDGYVWLGADRRRGLGAHLHDALGGDIPVIGVAKTRFRDTPSETEVLRGQSRHPLHVTAAGMDPATARDRIGRMHGPYRIPTLLAAVDRLARTGRP